MEKVLLEAFGSLSTCTFLRGEASAIYYPLVHSTSYPNRPAGMLQDEEEELESKHFLFHEPQSRLDLSAGFGRHWPDARGVFVAAGQRLVMWFNERDHVSVSSVQPDGNLQAAFARFSETMRCSEEAIRKSGHTFAHSARLGYLTSCPGNLGGARITVRLWLPLLSSSGRSDLSDICRQHGLRARSVPAKPDGKNDSVWEVTTCNRISSTEVEMVNSVLVGCNKLVARELEMAGSQPAAISNTTCLAPLRSVFSIMPGLGHQAFPGFPVDRCPDMLPPLSNHRSVAAEVLHRFPEIYSKLKDCCTQSGVSFAACIKPCFDNPGSPFTGAVAADEESYSLFGEFFEPIIRIVHGLQPSGALHPYEVSPMMVCKDHIDPSQKYVIAVRVESSRNLRAFCFAPSISRSERRTVERVLVDALSTLQDADLVGDYYPLPHSTSYASKPNGMTGEEAAEMHKCHFMFKEPQSREKLSSGLGLDWPEARGVFAAHSRRFVAWCNEEDHLRVVSMQSDGDIWAAFERFARANKGMEQALDNVNHGFSRNKRFGYLTVNPANLGAALRVTVLLRLPLLSGRPGFRDICKRLGLRVHNAGVVDARHSGDHCAVWGVSNIDTFSFSEPDSVKLVTAGCNKLVQMEETLSIATLAATLNNTPAGSAQKGVKMLRGSWSHTKSTKPAYDKMPKEQSENRDIRSFENAFAELRSPKTTRPKSSPSLRAAGRSDRTRRNHGNTSSMQSSFKSSSQDYSVPTSMWGTFERQSCNR